MPHPRKIPALPTLPPSRVRRKSGHTQKPGPPGACSVSYPDTLHGSPPRHLCPCIKMKESPRWQCEAPATHWLSHAPSSSAILSHLCDTEQRCSQHLCLAHSSSSIFSRAAHAPFHHSLPLGSTAKFSPWLPGLPLCQGPIHQFLLKH